MSVLAWPALILASTAFVADPPMKPEARVRAVLAAQVAAWNKGDLDGFMTGYWDSDDLSFYSAGTITKGKKNIAERYTKRYKAEGKEMGQLAFSDIEVQMLGEDTAIVRGRWKLVLKQETPDGLYTLIMKKFPAGWKIVHDHTSASEVVKAGEKK